MATAMARGGEITERNTMTTSEQFCDNCGSANPLTARFCQNCAAMLPSTNTTGTLAGQTLLASRYQLESRIGQGCIGAGSKAAGQRFTNPTIPTKEMTKA